MVVEIEVYKLFLFASAIITINFFISLKLVEEAIKMAYNSLHKGIMGSYKIIGKMLDVDVEKMLEEMEKSDEKARERGNG